MACNCTPRKVNCDVCPASIGPRYSTETRVCDPCNGNLAYKNISCGDGISAAVIDDASEKTYLYGNIIHENYHVPERECLPFISIPTNMETYERLNIATETFEGTFADNSILLEGEPCKDRHMFVFLNGLHQDEGQEYDYLLDGNKITFTHRNLTSGDRVTVKYNYYVLAGS